MAIKGYLGIDAGTQGLSVVFTNEDLKVLGTGEASYEMVSNLAEGCYEQLPADWDDALSNAMRHLRDQMNDDFEVLLFDVRPHFLRLGQSGHDLLVLDQRGGHVAEHRITVAGLALQLTAGNFMTHFKSSFVR